MDKLNSLVKRGIFVDKDKNGFTKAEQKALGDEFTKLHKERGDLINFKKMIAGKYFDYKDEEFIRLANTAGYVLAQEKVQPEQPSAPQEIKKPLKPETVTPAAEDKKTSQVKPSVTKGTEEAEYAVLYKELQQMKAGWTEEERKYPDGKLRKMQNELYYEIRDLEKPYIIGTVKVKRFLRKPLVTKERKFKTPEQYAADKAKIPQKTEELNKISKMLAVENLYATEFPSIYAPGENDKLLRSIVTTSDGRKLGAAVVKKSVYNSELKSNEDTWVTEYYPITFKQFPKNYDSEMPYYYYCVDKSAKPVEGRIELSNGKVVQE